MNPVKKVSGLLALLVISLVAEADFDLNEWQQRVAAESEIDRLGRLYIELILEEDPVQSATLGIHGKGELASYYDDRLPDVRPAFSTTMAEARQQFLVRLQGIDASGLTRDQQIDLHILTRRVQYHLLLQDVLHEGDNPLDWITRLGSAMSGLVLREYAPLEQRLASFGARCAATPSFLQQLRDRLTPADIQPTEVQKQVAAQRLAGMSRSGGLYDRSLPQLLADSSLDTEQRSRIEQACAEAVSAIDTFAAWFEAEILPRPNGEWRLGKELFDRKFALQLDYPMDAEQLLATAEGWLAMKGAELVETGRAIHDRYLAEELAAGSVQPASELPDAQVVRNIFNKLSLDRSTPESLISDSYAMADSIIGFVREQNLMDLPPASKLRIEPIPPHLAGNAVAMIQTAPPFEPHLESVWFWDIDLLSASPDYLKEYNRPALAVVYIHEGVPGHFVQLEYSNRFDRVIPKVFWNGPMVEGWAAYIVTQLIDQGFTVYPDHPLGHELQQMTDDKMILRTVINAIIDIRLHRTQWAEEDAVALMIDKGFQEEAEARGKMTRAKLGSVQLSSYFAGHRAIEEILEEYKAARGAAFSYKEFNERLVGAGSPPFFAIREYMLAE